MITMTILRSKLATYNRLTGEDLHLFNYTRASNPYGLMTGDHQEIMRGSKSDIYMFLDGAITGINSYRKAHNLN